MSPAVAVIIVAAGSGTRLGLGQPKAFVELGDRTILSRALDCGFGLTEPVQVVVVVPVDRLGQAEQIARQTAGRAAGSVTVVVGGDSRQGSVAAGLAALHPAVKIVLVHDAARALTPAEQFTAVIGAVRASGAGVVPGLPVSDTIKRMDAEGRALETVDRSQLSAIQTPQGFPRDALERAYAAAEQEFTDDAALFSAAGHDVRIVAGDPLAFKITTAWDLQRAEQMLHAAAAERPVEPPRTGVGIDAHAFAADGEAGGSLWLAGLEWPGERPLSGHSDGDAVAHAICDALLSASGLGDLGSVFGTSDPRFAGAHGDVFLRHTLGLLTDAGFGIGNVSVQIVGNRPRFGPRRTEAEALLSGILNAPVTVSATTTDGLGFTGRTEGIVAIATVLIHAVAQPR